MLVQSQGDFLKRLKKNCLPVVRKISSAIFGGNRSFVSWNIHQVVSCTEEDVTVEFLDYGNEAVLYDSQKVEEIQFK